MRQRRVFSLGHFCRRGRGWAGLGGNRNEPDSGGVFFGGDGLQARCKRLGRGSVCE